MRAGLRKRDGAKKGASPPDAADSGAAKGSGFPLSKTRASRGSSSDAAATPTTPAAQRKASVELRAACEANDLARARAAMAAGANLQAALTPLGSAALHIAAFDGKLELASMLVKEGAPVDLRRASEGLDTPMILACQNGHTEVVELLVSAGASIHAPDDFGATPLFIASKNGSVSIVKRLIELKAGVNTVAHGLRNNAPLAAAAYMGHAAVVQTLLKSGARPELKCEDKQTAEDHAKREGHQKIVDILRTHHAFHASPHASATASPQRSIRINSADVMPGGAPSEGVPPQSPASGGGGGGGGGAAGGMGLIMSLADEQQELEYRTHLLEQVDLLQGLDRELLPGIAKALVAENFQSRQPIVNVGEPGYCMYVPPLPDLPTLLTLLHATPPAHLLASHILPIA